MPGCFVPNCYSGNLRKTEEKRHLFRVKACNVETWSKAIPRKDRKLDARCVVCDLHFDPRFILKTFKHVVNGEEIEIDRERWILRDDAVPTIFPNLPSYLTKKLPKERKPPLKRQLSKAQTKRNGRKSLFALPPSSYTVTVSASLLQDSQTIRTSETSLDTSGAALFTSSTALSDSNSCPAHQLNIYTLATHPPRSDDHLEIVGDKPLVDLARIIDVPSQMPISQKEDQRDDSKVLSSRQWQLSKEELYNSRRKIKKLVFKNVKLMKENAQLRKELAKRNSDICGRIHSLSERPRRIVDHFLRALDYDKNGMRYEGRFILDCLLLKVRSGNAYEFLRTNNFLPLPHIKTLQNYIKSMSSKFGFDNVVCNEELYNRLKEQMATSRNDDNIVT